MGQHLLVEDDWLIINHIDYWQEQDTSVGHYAQRVFWDETPILC